MQYGKFSNHLKKQQIGNQYSKNLKIFRTFHTVSELLTGKHVAIECPKLSGTQYSNCKGFFIVVLLAICDAKYCFTYVDFGQYGSKNDSSVLRSSGLYKAFEENKFNVSALTEGLEDPLPCFLLGDEIFPYKTWLMRPFPGSLDDSQKIFNYRFSRGRHRKCIWYFGSKIANF